jgi:hypothetical protein
MRHKRRDAAYVLVLAEARLKLARIETAIQLLKEYLAAKSKRGSYARARLGG